MSQEVDPTPLRDHYTVLRWSRFRMARHQSEAARSVSAVSLKDSGWYLIFSFEPMVTGIDTPAVLSVVLTETTTTKGFPSSARNGTLQFTLVFRISTCRDVHRCARVDVIHRILNRRIRIITNGGAGLQTFRSGLSV